MLHSYILHIYTVFLVCRHEQTTKVHYKNVKAVGKLINFGTSL